MEVEQLGFVNVATLEAVVERIRRSQFKTWAVKEERERENGAVLWDPKRRSSIEIRV